MTNEEGQTHERKPVCCLAEEDFPGHGVTAGDALICHEADGSEGPEALLVTIKGRKVVADWLLRDLTGGAK